MLCLRNPMLGQAATHLRVRTSVLVLMFTTRSRVVRMDAYPANDSTLVRYLERSRNTDLQRGNSNMCCRISSERRVMIIVSSRSVASTGREDPI